MQKLYPLPESFDIKSDIVGSARLKIIVNCHLHIPIILGSLLISEFKARFSVLVHILEFGASAPATEGLSVLRCNTQRSHFPLSEDPRRLPATLPLQLSGKKVKFFHKIKIYWIFK